MAGFYLVLQPPGEGDLFSAIMKVQPVSVLMGFLLYLSAIGAGMLILYRCLRFMGATPPLAGLAKAWIFGSFLDNVAPTITPIGEAGMAYFLERFYRLSYTKTLAAIGMYVSSWGMSVSVFSTVGVILSQYLIGIPAEYLIPVIIVVSLFSIITMGWILLLTKKGLVQRIVFKVLKTYNKVYNKVKRRKVTYEHSIFDMEFNKSYDSLKLVLKDKGHLLSSVALFLIPQIAHVLCLYSILTVGFGVEISFFAVLMIHIVASVIGLISLVPSGLVVYEVVSSSALAGSVSALVAGASVFLYRLIFLWTTNLVGGLIGIAEGIENPERIKAP